MSLYLSLFPKSRGQFSSVQSLSHVRLFVTSWTTARLATLSITNSPSQTHVHHQLHQPNSCPLNWWCHPTIHPLLSPSPPALNLSQHQGLFKWVSSSHQVDVKLQNIGASDSVWVLPMNIQDWFPLGLTDWITLQSKGLSRVFFNTAVLKHQSFGAKLSLWSNSHIHTWPLEKP